MKAFRILIAAGVVALTMTASALLNTKSSEWAIDTDASSAKPGPEFWWFENATNWVLRTQFGGTVRPDVGFPDAGSIVALGDWNHRCRVYVKDGDVVDDILMLSVAHGHACNYFHFDIRKGAFVREVSNQSNNNTYEGTFVGGDAGNGAYGELFVSGGTLVSHKMYIGGGTRVNATNPGKGWLHVTDGGVVTNFGVFTVGNALCTSCVDFVASTYYGNRVSNTSFGYYTNGFTKIRVPVTFERSQWLNQGFVSVNGTADLYLLDHSRFNASEWDWSLKDFPLKMNGSPCQTNRVVIKDSTMVLYHPENDWNTTKGIYGKYYARWCKVGFCSRGYSEILQDNSVVTNCGVWFAPSFNGDKVTVSGETVPPPRYIVKGGRLYIHSTDNAGDNWMGYGQDVACGIAAYTNAVNSGTITFMDAADVSFPCVCTNLLLCGAGQASNTGINEKHYGITDYRPHFEYVLTKKGHRPVTIRRQTGVLGMYSVVPQGGLQIVQTNRFALLRHSTAASVMTTVDEPQFRAPNAELWTTGGFDDTPREWGVTLKDTAAIALGADLGEGVASGFVRLPRARSANLLGARLRLKLAPGAKTVAAVAAEMADAGYANVVENSDEVVVDLIASGMLKEGADNFALIDLNAPQDAVGVRDNVEVANAKVLSASVEYDRRGLVIFVR